MEIEGWTKTQLAELAEIYSGGTPSRAVPAYYDGDIPWIKSGEVNARRIRAADEFISELGLKNSSAKWVPAGAVLIAMYGATAGRVATLEIPATINQAILAIIARTNRAHSTFLFYSLESSARELLKRVQGSGQPNLSATLIRSIEFSVPPLPEQRKIAAILSAVDAVIERTQAVIDQLQQVKKALMQELLTRGIPGRHTRFKKTEIGEAPEGWEVVPLGDIIAKGPDNGIYLPKDEYGSGIPIVRIDNFSMGETLDRKDFQRVRIAPEKAAKYVLGVGDILINRVNSLSHLGKSAYIKRTYEDTIFESNMMRISVNKSLIDPRFVFLWMISERCRTHFQERAKRAIAQASINQTDVISLPIVIPRKEEQNSITQIIESSFSRIAAEQVSLNAAIFLKSALMSVLLSGEVRVKVEEGAA